jgi:hypothetical protein
MLNKRILSVLILISFVNICAGNVVDSCYSGKAEVNNGNVNFTLKPLSQLCSRDSNWGCFQEITNNIVYTFGCASEEDCIHLKNMKKGECCEKNDCNNPEKLSQLNKE